MFTPGTQTLNWFMFEACFPGSQLHEPKRGQLPRSNSLLMEWPPWPASTAAAACQSCALSRAWGALGSALGAKPSLPHTKHQTFPQKTCSEFTEVTFHFRLCTVLARVDKTSVSGDNALCLGMWTLWASGYPGVKHCEGGSRTSDKTNGPAAVVQQPFVCT